MRSHFGMMSSIIIVRSHFRFVECDRIFGMMSSIIIVRSHFRFVECDRIFGMMSSIIIVRSRSLTKLFARW
ncbi:hypothetical protein H6G04_19325 [Calothrix membranacea FACHB-236]|nr:hypothetical protein [Calothrix membranacea FACHB-236]